MNGYPARRTLIALLALLSLVVAACGTTGQSPGQSAASGPVTLRLLTTTSEPNLTATKGLIQRFEAANPSISITIQSVPFPDFYRTVDVGLASGNPPDIFFPDPSFVRSYVANSALLALDSAFTQQQIADYNPSLLKSVQINGHIYLGMIVDSGSLLYYNKDMFAKAGITPPSGTDGWWTWPQAKQAMQTVQQAVSTSDTFVWGSTFRTDPPNQYDGMPFPRSEGAVGSPTYNGISADGCSVTGYLDTPDAIAGLTFYQSLFTDKVIPTQTVPNAFETGLAATKVAPSDEVAVLKKYPDINWGVTPLPYLKTKIMHNGSQGFAVAAKTKHPQEALAFIKFAMSDEQSLQFLQDTFRPPARVSLAGKYAASSDPVLQLQIETLKIAGAARPVTAGFSEYNTITAKMFSDLANGAPVQSTVASTAQQVDAAIGKYCK